MNRLFQENFYWGDGRQPYCGIFGHSFIRRLCTRWNQGNLPRNLPFSGKAHGVGGLNTAGLHQLLRRCNLSKFDIVFIQIGENDMLSMSNHKLMYALVAIYNELKQQGVKHVAFGSMFHRHHRQYNKMAKRLNKILFKIHPEKVWHHGDRYYQHR